MKCRNKGVKTKKGKKLFFAICSQFERPKRKTDKKNFILTKKLHFSKRSAHNPHTGAYPGHTSGVHPHTSTSIQSSPNHPPVIPPTLENLSKNYRTSIENLSKIYRKSIENRSKIYRTSIENLSKIRLCWWGQVQIQWHILCACGATVANTGGACEGRGRECKKGFEAFQ